MSPEFEDLKKKAIDRFNSLSPAEQQALLRAQARSYCRGEAGIGSDRDEARYCKALADGDEDELAKLKEESAERLRQFDARWPEGS